MASGRLPASRVIYYHRVGQLIKGGPSGASSDGGAIITPPRHLEAHIALLRELGYRFATASELARHWRGSVPPPGIAVLTFDDGWRDGLTTVAPMLTALGVRATFFVCPGRFGIPAPELGDARVMTESEARELHDLGMELASHSLSHPDLRKLSDAELRVELSWSRDALESITSEPCRTFAYPSGWRDRRVERAVADAGYEVAFIDRHGLWRKLAAPRVHAPTVGAPETVIERLRLSWDQRGGDWRIRRGVRAARH